MGPIRDRHRLSARKLLASYGSRAALPSFCRNGPMSKRTRRWTAGAEHWVLYLKPPTRVESRLLPRASKLKDARPALAMRVP